ncbi:MAG: DUF255 domain-containing protein [Bacteroidota bacterium]
MKWIYLTPLLALLMGFSPAEPKAEINWMSWEEAVEASETEQRKVLVDFYTDWCGWCKRMDKTTYEDPSVVDYINKNYYAVKFDAEQKEDIVVKGRTFKFVKNGRRGYHELAASIMQGKMSYPTTSFLDENFNLLTNVPGFQQAKQFMPILAYFGEDAYKSEGWNSFSQNYMKSGK